MRAILAARWRQWARIRARGSAAERGFTLVELLVVITILGILAGITVFAVRGIGDKGMSAAIAADQATIDTAQEAYCANNGEYGTMDQLVGSGLLTDSSTYHLGMTLGSGQRCGTGAQSSYALYNPLAPVVAAGEIAVGASPTDIEVNAATHKIFVLNTGDNTVSMIDGGSKAVEGSFTLAAAATTLDRITVDSVYNLVYVSVGGGAGYEVIDVASGNVSTLTYGPGLEPQAGAVSGAPPTVVVDQVSGKAYIWAMDPNTYGFALNVYDNSVAPSEVLDPADLTGGASIAYPYPVPQSQDVHAFQWATVVDPGVALYAAINLIDPSSFAGQGMHWLVQDLATGIVSLEQFPATPDTVDPTFVYNALGGAYLDPVSHTAYVQFGWAPFNAGCVEPGCKTAFETMKLGGGPQVAFTVAPPSPANQPGNWASTAENGLPRTLVNPLTGDLFVPGTSAAPSPYLQVSRVSDGVRMATTGPVLGQTRVSFGDEIVAEKRFALDPTSNRIYWAPVYSSSPPTGTPPGAVAGGLQYFDATTLLPAAAPVTAGRQFVALAVDPATSTLYAVDMAGGKVATFHD